MDTKTDSKTEKKGKSKKHYWLLVDLAVTAFILAILLHKPFGYKPLGSSYRRGRVHPYLTHLSSEIYNGAQLQEPFEVVVLEDKLNESIGSWSEISEDIILTAPAASFRPGRITIMATAVIKGIKLVVTAALEPEMNEDGLLNLKVDKAKLGAMNITPLARMIAKRKYTQRLATMPVDTEHWRTKIAGSLLNDEPFEPVFPIEDKKVRLEQITIEKKKLILIFTPVL